MKLIYETMLEQVEIVYTLTAGRPATYDDPAEGGDLEIEEVWLMDGNGHKVLDINPYLSGAMFEALFGKDIYESLIRSGDDAIADEKAAAAEHRWEVENDR